MDTQTLLREAIAAVKAGDKARGRALLARVSQADPRNEHTWMWISEVVETDERRAYCLRRVLAINPENESAKKGLQSLIWEPIQKAERRKPNRMPLIIFIAALVVSIPYCGLLIGFVTRSPSDTSKPLPGSNVGYL